MGYQIIKQPNDKFAVFSSYTDTVIVWDADESDIVDFFGERAAKQARETAEQILVDVKAGDAEHAYSQFAITWDEALETDREHGGEAWQKWAS